MGAGQFFVARVGSGQPSLDWVWKFSSKFFNFCRVKKYPGRPLIYCVSKVCSALVGSVGSSPISSWEAWDQGLNLTVPSQMSLKSGCESEHICNNKTTKGFVLV